MISQPANLTILNLNSINYSSTYSLLLDLFLRKGEQSVQGVYLNGHKLWEGEDWGARIRSASLKHFYIGDDVTTLHGQISHQGVGGFCTIDEAIADIGNCKKMHLVHNFLGFIFF